MKTVQRKLYNRTSMEAIMVYLFWFYLVLSTLKPLGALDTIVANQTIKDGESIVSATEIFELGFFSPGNSKNRYLGIWYKKVGSGTVVWVANRNAPLHDTSGVLTVTNKGILALLNRTNSIIWTSISSTSPHNPVAQLLDTGNLVLKDGNDNFLWQSFDYPGDTLLPGMKFGIDRVTGLDRHLSSWKSADDPAPGDFTFICDPRGYPQFIIRNGSANKSRLGSWNGIGFSGSPNLRPNTIYRFSFVFSEKEVYYMYELTNGSIFSRFVLNQNGVAQRWTWVDRIQGWEVYLNAPIDYCDIYGLCGKYGSCNIANSPICGCLQKFVPKYPRDWNVADWSNGCVRETPLDCQNGDGFLKYSHLKLPDTQHSWINETMNIKECGMICLNNCSCMAYTHLDIRRGGSGCLLWFGDLIDIREFPQGGQDIYIRVASSELGGSEGKKRKKILISLILLIGTFLLGLTLVVYARRKKNKRQQKEGRLRHNSKQDENKETHEEDVELPLIDLGTIVTATNNFSINNKLGEGGFGPVYKGILEEGKEIAVKRLSKNSRQGHDEFKNEVVCIAKLQHRNLVKLIGCCIHEEEKMLIYEYMLNRGLDSFIFDEIRSKFLDWPTRFHIINGIARGLLYLHQDSRLRIIHRDLKVSNILLDKDLNPKISDFGMARIFGGDETEATTNRVVGTYGYMSPEYQLDGLFSVKSDVFSFGVLVLEIVSGRRNRGFFHRDHHHNLLGHAWNLYIAGRSEELIDAQLGHLPEVLRSIHISLLCVQQDPKDRPNMSYVVMMLGSEVVLPQPKPPGFFTERNNSVGEFLSSENAPTSLNEVTITLLGAR